MTDARHAERSHCPPRPRRWVVDLGARLGGSLQQCIDDDGLARAAERAAGLPADLSPADFTYLPPVDRPEKVICIGVNYANRNAEYRDGSEPRQVMVRLVSGVT